MDKKFIWGGLFLGSSLGGAVPMLWDADLLSLSGMVFSVIGGLVGIWAGYRVAQSF